MSLSRATVVEICSYKVIGPWHIWIVKYSNGQQRTIEMLHPADGKDGVKLGDRYTEHSFADSNKDRMRDDK